MGCVVPNDKTDLVERLRDRTYSILLGPPLKICDEAADEIERLRKSLRNWIDGLTLTGMKDETGLVERLRAYHVSDTFDKPFHPEICEEAADEIKRLRGDLQHNLESPRLGHRSYNPY